MLCESRLCPCQHFVKLIRQNSQDKWISTCPLYQCRDGIGVNIAHLPRLRHLCGWNHLIARCIDCHTRTAGDGFYVIFDVPARAIECARSAIADLGPLGVEIRAGVHTGDCETADGKCAGLAVSIGARVMSRAGPSEILVSQTVKDLTAGGDLGFEDAGEHELKGIADRWRLYRVEA